MFDISWQELMLIAVVALLVIPPKDLPRAMAAAGKWMRYAKSLMRDFHNGLDELAREAELSELRKQARDASAKLSAPLTLENFPMDPETSGTSGDSPSPTLSPRGLTTGSRNSLDTAIKSRDDE